MFEFTRIVPGSGCDIIVIKALEGGKTALWDVGMFYCAENAISMVKAQLNGGYPDYIILSHTHYDHIGALSVFREAFPKAEVIGSEYSAYILGRESARQLMKEMSESAAKQYNIHVKHPFDTNGFYLDRIVKNEDIIDFGKEKLKVYYTPGHTKCSMSLFDEESKTLLASETTGVYENADWSHVQVLTGYQDTMDSIDLCMSLNPDAILTPHLGTTTMEIGPKEFLELGKKSAKEFRDKITECENSDISHEETMEILKNEFHSKHASSTEGQPLKAFLVNTEAFIKCLRREFPEDFEQ